MLKLICKGLDSFKLSIAKTMPTKPASSKLIAILHLMYGILIFCIIRLVDFLKLIITFVDSYIWTPIKYFIRLFLLILFVRLPNIIIKFNNGKLPWKQSAIIWLIIVIFCAILGWIVYKIITYVDPNPPSQPIIYSSPVSTEWYIIGVSELITFIKAFWKDPSLKDYTFVPPPFIQVLIMFYEQSQEKKKKKQEKADKYQEKINKKHEEEEAQAAKDLEEFFKNLEAIHKAASKSRK